MNKYIFDILQNAIKTGKDISTIVFKPIIERVAPYFEVQSERNNEIEVNVWKRFYKIFGNLTFLQEKDEKNKVFYEYFNIMLHILGKIDLLAGLNKKYIYMEFIERNLNNINIFNSDEKYIIINNLLELYQNGNYLELFQKTIKEIFVNYYFYDRKETNEFILYLSISESEESKSKVEFIKNMFFPFDLKLTVCFYYHFGIIGVDKTMEIGEIRIIE